MPHKGNGQEVAHKELYEAVWKKEYMYDDRNIMAHEQFEMVIFPGL